MRQLHIFSVTHLIHSLILLLHSWRDFMNTSKHAQCYRKFFDRLVRLGGLYIRLRQFFYYCFLFNVNPLSVNFTKRSNILKQFLGKLPMNCLSVFDHFVRLALKGLKIVATCGVWFTLSFALRVQMAA